MWMATVKTTVIEAKALARMINGFGVFGSQLLNNNRPDFYDRAKNNLSRYKTEYKAVLIALDEAAESNKSERPSRLIDDILRYARQDARGCMDVANRCLLACAFLGHLLANTDGISEPVENPRHDTVLH
jgi:hypothetical protein